MTASVLAHDGGAVDYTTGKVLALSFRNAVLVLCPSDLNLGITVCYSITTLYAHLHCFCSSFFASNPTTVHEVHSLKYAKLNISQLFYTHTHTHTHHTLK